MQKSCLLLRPAFFIVQTKKRVNLPQSIQYLSENRSVWGLSGAPRLYRLKSLSMGNPKILVVEDDPTIQESLAELLQLEGYSVVTANNGQEALDCLQSSDLPALIFLDLMMPVMTGWEFLEKKIFDSRLAEIPVVIVSAVNDTKIVDGSKQFIRKPIKIDSILEAAKKYCGATKEQV